MAFVAVGFYRALETDVDDCAGYRKAATPLIAKEGNHEYDRALCGGGTRH